MSMYPKKCRRNRELVKRRMRDPKKWSFRKLADFYNIKVSTVYKIWKRDKNAMK